MSFRCWSTNFDHEDAHQPARTCEGQKSLQPRCPESPRCDADWYIMAIYMAMIYHGQGLALWYIMAIYDVYCIKHMCLYIQSSWSRIWFLDQAQTSPKREDGKMDPWQTWWFLGQPKNTTDPMHSEGHRAASCKTKALKTYCWLYSIYPCISMYIRWYSHYIHTFVA